MSESRSCDAVIVGAGFAGLYMLYRLREAGFEARVFEAGDDVGGTWYWNRYPGARCDIESLEYSYQFSEELQQEWDWSERYATQAEILAYVNHVADRFDLRRDITFETRVTSATFDDSASRWQIETDAGPVSARFLVMATGCLSSTNTPDFPGMDEFTGEIFHTGKWPHEGVDFGGKRVAVIGTGSSAIQSIPLIAAEAAQLTVFQRTANYSVPAHNGPLDPEHVRRVKAEYADFRARNRSMAFGAGADYPGDPSPAKAASPEERLERYEDRWRHGGLPFVAAYGDLLLDAESNETAAEFLRGKIHDLVDDPAVAELLSPQQVVGCKRLCVDTGYYRTFNRSNVSLVDVSASPIEALTARGLRVGESEYVFDVIVFATGFDAMTGALLKVDIRGVGGVTLKEKWAEGPRSYLGLGTAGFPNLFTITGPGSPSVLSNMLPSIEQHVNWIADCIEWLRAGGHERIEATAPAEVDWVELVTTIAGYTLYPSCNSWYLGANVPGKPRVFMPFLGVPTYAAKCDEVAANDYEGFAVT